MAIASYSICNLRSFLDETTIEVRPLTLFFGANNSGKSTLLRTLPLLAESVREPDPDAALAYRGEASRRGSFNELVPRLPGTREEISVALSWDDTQDSLQSVRIVFRELKRLGLSSRVIVKSMEGLIGDGRHLFGIEWCDEQPKTGPSHYREMPPAGRSERASLPVQFSGPVPDVSSGNLASVAAKLRRLGDEVHWLGAVREPPERMIRSESVRRPRRMGHKGQEALPFLFYDKQEKGDILPSVSHWYERHFRRSLDIRSTASGDFFATLARVDSPEYGVNLTDCGEGIAQVLPVLVLAAMAESGQLGDAPVLALEQPELHLHTDAQGALAAHLCTLVQGHQPPRFLIETHSEIFMLEIERAMLEGRISQDQVLFYFVWMTEGGQTLVERVPLDSLARPQGLPRIFGESLALARKLASLRREAERSRS
jgi:energy-coupling factor transporter ATP-binding protein EcfA2